MISAYIYGDTTPTESTGHEWLCTMEFYGEYGKRLTKRMYKKILDQMFFDEAEHTNGHEVHANIFQGDEYLFTITYKTKYGVVWFDDKDCYPEYGVNGYIFINGTLVRSFVVAC